MLDRAAVHAVIIYFNYGIDSLDPMHNLGFALDAVVTESGVDEYDGHELAMDNSHGSYYLYGQNAEQLFKKVLPLLQQTTFTKDAIALLRFGPLGSQAKELEVELAALGEG